MANPVYISKFLSPVVAGGIAQSQNTSAAGDLVLNGSLVQDGVAILDTQRSVSVVSNSGDNNNGIIFTIYGTAEDGTEVSEPLLGVNGTGSLTTQKDFKTVTRIAVSAATTAAVVVNTAAVGATAWNRVGSCAMFRSLAVALVPASTATFQFQYTLDDPNNLPNGVALPQIFNLALTSNFGTISFPIFAWRLRLQTANVSVRGTIVQSGLETL